jgi:hypothetical protein
MDKLARWSGQLVDLATLVSEWDRRFLDKPRTRRARELYSICLFTLCIENRTNQRYLVGFQELGAAVKPIGMDDVFNGNFGEIEDCDIILVDEPQEIGQVEVLHHRCQLVSYIHQPSTKEEDLVKFLEEKKLKVPRDEDLRLVIHVEQEGPLNYAFLYAYLKHRSIPCPYSQVFVLEQIANNPRRWFCALVHPELAIFPELDEQTAKDLVVRRKRTRDGNLFEMN